MYNDEDLLSDCINTARTLEALIDHAQKNFSVSLM